ncbi:hypothetical protein chiPu_0023137 [Chiloscyllium punctatum]|uniref:Uncharacterized protein n=1 Tax=Chiloscyllium punctatum TaxID=137246 RepID=A0A401T9K4_CHIPU|nr:hypothetical protein [Chiloscyllium punctatum]
MQCGLEIEPTAVWRMCPVWSEDWAWRNLQIKSNAFGKIGRMRCRLETGHSWSGVWAPSGPETGPCAVCSLSPVCFGELAGCNLGTGNGVVWRLGPVQSGSRFRLIRRLTLVRYGESKKCVMETWTGVVNRVVWYGLVVEPSAVCRLGLCGLETQSVPPGVSVWCCLVTGPAVLWIRNLVQSGDQPVVEERLVLFHLKTVLGQYRDWTQCSLEIWLDTMWSLGSVPFGDCPLCVWRLEMVRTEDWAQSGQAILSGMVLSVDQVWSGNSDQYRVETVTSTV